MAFISRFLCVCLVGKISRFWSVKWFRFYVSKTKWRKISTLIYDHNGMEIVDQHTDTHRKFSTKETISFCMLSEVLFCFLYNESMEEKMLAQIRMERWLNSFQLSVYIWLPYANPALEIPSNTEQKELFWNRKSAWISVNQKCASATSIQSMHTNNAIEQRKKKKYSRTELE